jgi:transcriptional regulator with XRE-family HTH domain
MPKKTVPTSPKATPAGAQVKALRDKAGLTSAELAEEAGLGGISAVSRVENGRNTPLETLQRLADALARRSGRPVTIVVYSGLPEPTHDRPGRSAALAAEKDRSDPLT